MWNCKQKLVGQMRIANIGRFVLARDNPSSPIHAARTAVAAVLSYLVAQSFHLPEAYWAPISTVIVMQSTLGASLPISVQRFVGTGIGAVTGAAVASWLSGSVWAFGAALFAIGILCAVVGVERSAYRYAGITLTIIMLVKPSANAWPIALHRFFEVSLGIAVGLVFSAVWPEKELSGSSVPHQSDALSQRQIGSISEGGTDAHRIAG